MDDALWGKISRFLPACEVRRSRRPRTDDRIIMDAILFVLRSNCHWKALDQHRLSSGSTVHRRFREWVKAGVFEEMRRAGVLNIEALRNIDWTRVECHSKVRRIRSSESDNRNLSRG